MSKNKKIEFNVCITDENGNIIAKKGITATWPHNLREQVSNLVGYDSNTFISEVLHSNLIQRITIQDIKDLLEEIERKENG